MRALLLPVGPDSYAIELGLVREVVTAPRLTALPTAPRSVVGLFNLRGDVVPLLDTGLLLGLAALGAPAYAVVVETPRGVAGLGASAEPEVRDLSEQAMPADLPGTTRSHDLGDRIATVLDLGELIAPLAAEGHA
ncbi:MAG: chemotaxis protein CheW [Actinobacteria bacterium]|nr:chemotaxis protein CheW [Actinomycetota bacterium]